MTTAETYVTAAFLVVLAVVLLWLVIYAFKMKRLESEVRELEQWVSSKDLNSPNPSQSFSKSDAEVTKSDVSDLELGRSIAGTDD
tara:strand:+ start:1062 stop:1316 length:255 start_codon:yes stop_codon:yes gene_type:complete